MRSQCTVLFEEPFWIGIFELWDEDRYSVCRVVFGKEPKSSELNEWLLGHYSELGFKTSDGHVAYKIIKSNPKKLKKEISRVVEGKYQGTKAQQALQSMHEEEKEVRKKLSRQAKEEQLEQRFEQKQEKKKQKKRGH